MAKVVLIGTSHKYQTRGQNHETEHVDQFEHVLSSLCSEHECMGIAEEMNQAALAERGVSESVALAVSAALGVAHQLSDPLPEIREQLDIICDENLFRAERWLEDWGQERIETAVRKSHESRERYWLTQLRILNASPLLFICGANHLEPFAALLRENGFEVVVAFSDWVPNPSFHRTCAKSRAGR
ncbi:MAG: hypothetical protein WBM28_04095 [Burkholderiales bacterium]